MSKPMGNLFIVAAPSGGGKTSLVQAMVSKLNNIAISISHTTRPKRPCEQEGQDYFFVSEAQFKTLIAEQAFVEYAKVYQHYYGTSIQQIANRRADGLDIVLDIDWQGAEQIKRLMPDAVLIFIIPPSLKILEERLQSRGQDKKEVISFRMQEAKAELRHYKAFDYVIVNDDFEKAVSELSSIVIANRLSLARQEVEQEALLSFLLR